MKKLVFVFSLICISTQFLSAQGEFEFEEEKFDFGTIKEGDPAKHSFKFKNTGNEPIIITNVKASCGCTTPSWTREPVPPGGTGEVTAAYSSKNRPGSFHKSITITSNAKTPTKVLRISGFTEKDLTGLYTEEQIANSPKIKVEDGRFNFGNIIRGNTVTHNFVIQNNGKSDLKINNIRSNCGCVTYEMTEETIKPGEKGTMKLSYRPRNLGKRLERVHIQSNDITKSTPVTIYLEGNTIENSDSKSIIKGDGTITF